MTTKTYRKKLREAIFEAMPEIIKCADLNVSLDVMYRKDAAEDIFVAVWKVITEHDSDDE